MDRSNRNGRISLEQTERLLNSSDAIRVMVPETRRLALSDLLERKALLQKTVCSAAWFSACWEEGKKFPPAADTTPMVACQCERCIRKGTLWPTNYCEVTSVTNEDGSRSRRVHSYECILESLSDWDAARLPSSPSGMALRAVREGRIKIRRVRTKLGGTRRRVV